MTKNIAKPFLKWAGGKGQLLQQFEKFYPKTQKIDNYVEPFVGGGAVLFDVLQKFDTKKVVAMDTNKELVNCYNCLKHDVEDVIRLLQKLQDEYMGFAEQDRRQLYLDIRDKYNNKELGDRIDCQKASYFIFLNRTCFNGLYRVNSKGKFNVPFGKYKNPKICNQDNLRAVACALQKVDIHCGDYSECVNMLNQNGFVYFDPPYRPLTGTASFVGYSKDGFDDSDQTKLAKLVIDLNKKGVKIMLSNSDPKNANVNDLFFDELYKGFCIKRIKAKRIINSKAEKRGEITELLIRNYTNGEEY